MITAWRIVDWAFVETAYSGDGAKRFGGRWHSPGTRVVYTAESLALATLEIVVHAPDNWTMREFAAVPCSFPEKIVHELDQKLLPDDWADNISPPELRRFGDAWARNHISAALKVPSAVTRVEFNYLLNPEHRDFRLIEVGEARPFSLDSRLPM